MAAYNQPVIGFNQAAVWYLVKGNEKGAMEVEGNG
jgi:hypothetical protein